MTKRRVPIDLRLILPRLAAIVTVTAWAWFYAESVGALIQQEQLESKFQDILIPAGEKHWIVIPASEPAGSGQLQSNEKTLACRGTISTDLKKSERKKAAHELPADRAESANSNLPLVPEQALPVEVLLRAYTIDAARMFGIEDETGSLRVGKAADLVLVDRDPLAAGTVVRDTQVLGTMIDGVWVYRKKK